MDRSKSAVRHTLDQVKGFLAQESPPKLTEADTKANFIEPIIAALGWTGIGSVTREYYVKNSQEFIDYVMRGPSGLLLAIEAKALQSDLTDKAAAQLIQYCSVEGIEWAALTNGRELHFFNTFLKPDLAAKRILSLDLLAFNNDEEFDALFLQLSQLSRDNVTTPAGVRSWLNQRRMDTALRSILFDPNSQTTKQLRRVLNQAEVTATAQDVVQWFRSHLGAPTTVLPPRDSAARGSGEHRPTSLPLRRDVPRAPSRDKAFDPGQSIVFRGEHHRLLPLFDTLSRAIESRIPSTVWRSLKYYVAAETDGRTFLALKRRAGTLVIGLTLPDDAGGPQLADNRNEFNWSRMTKVTRIQSESDITEELLALVVEAANYARAATSRKQHHGVAMQDLVEAGLLHPGETVVLATSTRDLATATIAENGDIVWQGRVYSTPSNQAFAALMGRQSLNGWTSWFVERPDGRRSLAHIRSDLHEPAEGLGSG